MFTALGPGHPGAPLAVAEAMTTKRFAGEVVQLTCDCELGRQGERAVVVQLETSSWTGSVAFMTLCFVDRDPGSRKVNTGADYLYLRSC